jgi:S1-C subfamily serine protease
VSAVGGAWRTWRGGRIDQSFRLDLQPFTGFSGGPLVDVEGQIIGINTSGPRRSVTTIPVATVNRVVDQLLAKGRIARGFLGVALQPVRLPSRQGGADRGLLTIMVEPGSPAEKAGLTIGDIITRIADKPLNQVMDLQSTLDPEQVGKSVVLQLLRGGQKQNITVTVAERPE